MTCHDPHHDAETSAAYYEAKCLGCHAATADAHRPSPEDPRRVPCPVNPTSDCLRCHMPSVKGAVPHSAFTDHYIRVRREAAGRG